MSLRASRLGHILLIKGSKKSLIFRRKIESCRPFLNQPGKRSLVVFLSFFRDPFDGLPHFLPLWLNGRHSEILLCPLSKYYSAVLLSCCKQPRNSALKHRVSRLHRSNIFPSSPILQEMRMILPEHSLRPYPSEELFARSWQSEHSPSSDNRVVSCLSGRPGGSSQP
jgi:hypothetical protein